MGNAPPGFKFLHRIDCLLSTSTCTRKIRLFMTRNQIQIRLSRPLTIGSQYPKNVYTNSEFLNIHPLACFTNDTKAIPKSLRQGFPKVRRVDLELQSAVNNLYNQRWRVRQRKSKPQSNPPPEAVDRQRQRGQAEYGCRRSCCCSSRPYCYILNPDRRVTKNWPRSIFFTEPLKILTIVAVSAPWICRKGLNALHRLKPSSFCQRQRHCSSGQ